LEEDLAKSAKRVAAAETDVKELVWKIDYTFMT
jgi:hypothetical protein